MSVGIIGAGRVGCSMAFALSKRGMPISGIYSRTLDSAESAARRIYCSVSEDLYSLVEGSSIVFLTVPDHSIRETAGRIIQSAGRRELSGRVFFHCSGALASDVLEQIREAGGITASLHPIQTFPDRMDSWNSMYGVCFGYEGMKESEDAAEEIVRLLGGTLLRVNAEYKSLYHAAACILSNYMVTLSHSAERLLECAGIDRDIGVNAFAPLLKSTVENIQRLGSTEALTGPISRGDCGTVSAHLEAMGRKLPDETELYKSLGRATVLLALEKGTINEDRAQELMWLMGGAE